MRTLCWVCRRPILEDEEAASVFVPGGGVRGAPGSTKPAHAVCLPVADAGDPMPMARIELDVSASQESEALSDEP